MIPLIVITENRPAVNVWSKEEVERFLSVVDDPRYLAIFINAYGSGLRVSEICKLRIEDVDSKDMRLFIQQTKDGKDGFAFVGFKTGG